MRVSGSWPCSSRRGFSALTWSIAAEHAVDAALVGKRRAEVGHEDVAGEQHAVIGQVDQQRVVGLAAARGQQRKARAADRHLDRPVDRDVGLVG